MPQAGERGVLLLETVCALGEHEAVNLVDESMTRCSQSLRGRGCRPTRAWVLARMREGFLALARDFPDRITVIDGARAPEQVAQDILGVVTSRLR